MKAAACPFVSFNSAYKVTCVQERCVEQMKEGRKGRKEGGKRGRGGRKERDSSFYDQEEDGCKSRQNPG